MKKLISYMKCIFTPLSVFMQLFLGVVAAILSGIIEYFVLKDLFSKIIIDGNIINSKYLPLIIVLVLEGSKLFFHFAQEAFKDDTKVSASAINFSNLIKFFKYILIVFSFACTLIYTANTLYFNTQQEKQSAYQTEEQAINNDYTQKIIDLEKEFINNQNALVDEYKRELDEAEEDLKNHQIIYTPKYLYDRTLEEHKRLESKVKELEAEYRQVLKDKEIGLENNSKFVAARQAILDEQNDKIADLEEKTLDSNEGDNEYIKVFLLLIFNTFLKEDTYPRWLYFSICIIIAIAIAVVLEAIISISQKLLALTSKDLESALEADYGITDLEIKDNIKSVLRMVASVGVSFAIYVIFGLINEISLNKTNLFIGLACCIITLMICRYLPQKNYQPKTKIVTKQDKAEDAIRRFWNDEGKNMLIKGLLTFVIYAIMAIGFGQNATEITVPAIGVTIGTSLGQLLHIIPITNNK